MKSRTANSNWHKPVKAQFTVSEDAGDTVVSCQYWDVRHSSGAGGNISSIVFPHGTGKNMFSAPCATQINANLCDEALPMFSNDRDGEPVISHGTKGETVWVKSRSRLLNPEGKALPVTCDHHWEYHPWGYVRQQVKLTCSRPIDNFWRVTIARPVVASHINEFGARRAPTESIDWRITCTIGPWLKLQGGESFGDYGAAAGQVPMHFIFLKRGVEGFDWFMGPNLDQWYRQIVDRAAITRFYIHYRPDLDGYEAQLCPAHYVENNGASLQGTYTFDFYMGLPFVLPRVTPLVRSAGAALISRKGKSGSSKVLVNDVSIDEYGSKGVQLARLHDDGPTPDGIFWRGCAYPPYPPSRMKRMDSLIRRLKRNGTRVVPYFSLHEWHPDVPPFKSKARECMRDGDGSGEMFHNYWVYGEFGAQMCMKSDWARIRKETIDVVLRNHDFDGIYYDWCVALPCRNKKHARFMHWDIDEFLQHLEWTRERVGADGVMYLHQSNNPFVVASNMANFVLTFEEGNIEKVNPDIFPPDAQFMGNVPVGVLPGKAGAEAIRRFVLCGLLNHLSSDTNKREALKIGKQTAGIDFTRYRRFENHRTTAVKVSRKGLRAAVYWNDKEALVMLVNMSDKAQTFKWRLLPSRIGWGRDRYQAAGVAVSRLPALGFRYVRVRRARRD